VPRWVLSIAKEKTLVFELGDIVMFKLQKVHSEIKSSLEVFSSWFQI
jgi:hypothetical protein